MSALTPPTQAYPQARPAVASPQVQQQSAPENSRLMLLARSLESRMQGISKLLSKKASAQFSAQLQQWGVNLGPHWATRNAGENSKLPLDLVKSINDKPKFGFWFNMGAPRVFKIDQNRFRSNRTN
jgi:hypothetical protein